MATENIENPYNGENVLLINKIPLNIHNVGIYFREFFDKNKSYYELITKEHEFQDLGILGKDGQSYRKGIYLTDVDQSYIVDEINFKLLRCSTNLSGPTDSFRDTDIEILDKVNSVAKLYFKDDSIDLNHVLAQTYHNSVNEDGKERKAKISIHSDKTKDMPNNGLIAFCTFYKDYDPDSYCFNSELFPNAKRNHDSDDPFDYRFKHDTTVLTKMRFRLKKEVTNPSLVRQFDITLYPHSLFIMSLHMNRLYTHEIVPSNLPIDQIPTRMGYVIRCSNTDAIYNDKEKKTYIITSTNKRALLEEPTEEGLKELKDLYYQENMTIEPVDYTDKFFFSMNSGDYIKPIL